MSEITKSFGITTLAVASKAECPSGMRLARIIRKDEKKDGIVIKKLDSMGCFIPVVSEAKVQAFMAMPAGMEAFKELIESLEEKAIRSVYEASERSPCETDLGLDCLAAIASATSTSVRLSKDSITAWFKAEGMIRLQNAFMAKGISIEQAQQVAANYLPHFVRLAEKGKIAFDAVIFPKFQRACEVLFAESESTFELKMLEKLEDCFVPCIDNLGLDL